VQSFPDFFFLVAFEFAKQMIYCLSHTSNPFFSGYFGDGVSQNICPGWPRTVILWISVSQVPVIAGMSHQHSAIF
jgi:hypothetical protein